MVLDEKIVTEEIIDRYFKKLKENLSVDVAIVGGSPSGLLCSHLLAKNGFKGTAVEMANLHVDPLIHSIEVCC